MTAEEKENLLVIINYTIGTDPSISALKNRFTERTVEVAESMLMELSKCNEAIKKLVADLISGGKVLARGWLKRVLNVAARVVKESTFRTHSCSVTVKYQWKRSLILSAM